MAIGNRLNYDQKIRVIVLTSPIDRDNSPGVSGIFFAEKGIFPPIRIMHITWQLSPLVPLPGDVR